MLCLIPCVRLCGWLAGRCAGLLHPGQAACVQPLGTAPTPTLPTLLPIQDIDIKEIAAASDAIVLAAGATKPRDLPIDGR